ncbi:MAG: hypothetical protein ACRDZ3_06955 [Acidimicrobiia bacterium]
MGCGADPRSEPLGPRQAEGDDVSQSFKVPGAGPGQILDYYARELDGWDAVEPVHLLGPGKPIGRHGRGRSG